MSCNHRLAFGFEAPEKHNNARRSRALKIGSAITGLLGVATTATLAQTNGFRAHDPGPRPNPQSCFFTQLAASL